MAYILVFGVVLALNCLGVWVFQLLWNWLLVALFGAAVISYWQAFGIWMLLRIVGSFFKSAKAKG